MTDTRNDFRAAQREFAAHLRDPALNPAPADVEDRRMQIYRDLFFNNITGFLANSYPVLAAQLGEDGWNALIRDFFRDHKSETPLFPQVAREFLNYLADERPESDKSQSDPEYLYELAHFEWIETELKLAADPEPDPDVAENEDLLENLPVLSPLAWAVSYEWPVSEFRKDSAPDAKAEQPQHFLIYRDSKGKVIYTQLNGVSARLYQLLDEGTARSGRAALETIAKELSHPEPGQVMDAGLQILQKWQELGVISGARRI